MMTGRVINSNGFEAVMAIIAVAGGMGAWMAIPYLLELSGVVFGCLTLLWIRRAMPMCARLQYAAVSGISGLALAPMLVDVARHFAPFLTDSVKLAIGFATVMVCLPLVMLVRAGTKWVEDHPEKVMAWLWSLVPESWRGKK